MIVATNKQSRKNIIVVLQYIVIILWYVVFYCDIMLYFQGYNDHQELVSRLTLHYWDYYRYIMLTVLLATTPHKSTLHGYS